MWFRVFVWKDSLSQPLRLSLQPDDSGLCDYSGSTRPRLPAHPTSQPHTKRTTYASTTMQATTSDIFRTLSTPRERGGLGKGLIMPSLPHPRHMLMVMVTYPPYIRDAHRMDRFLGCNATAMSSPIRNSRAQSCHCLYLHLHGTNTYIYI